MFGAVGTAGQRCTTTRRLFVHESIYDNVLDTLVKAYKQVEGKIGDPEPADHADGSAQQPGRGAGLSRRDREGQGRPAARCATGGKALTDRKGNFVLPTIVTGLNELRTRSCRPRPSRRSST